MLNKKLPRIKNIQILWNSDINKFYTTNNTKKDVFIGKYEQPLRIKYGLEVFVFVRSNWIRFSHPEVIVQCIYFCNEKLSAHVIYSQMLSLYKR
jgi:hypothetical protein